MPTSAQADDGGMGMNIVEFLEARIAEDEATANEATGARWIVLPGVNASLVNIAPALVRDEKWKYGRFGHIATTSHDAAYAEHIARHDPARVLAECAAKREIIKQAQKAAEAESYFDDYEWQGTVERSQPLAGDAILYALAAVYKDHPDYQQEWAL